MYEPDYTYTLEEFKKIAELDPLHKYEYVDGRIRMLSRGSPAHAQIANNIGYLLVGALLDEECNVYNSDVTVKLMDQRVYCPDVTVSCDPHDWTRMDALESPNVVVEVISPSTERIDKLEKLAAYQQYPTILEILYVDSRRYYIEHYHRTGVSSWQFFILQHDDESIDLSSIGVKFPVREVYRKVFLDKEEALFEK
jgi:Uma2 family endonuclease